MRLTEFSLYALRAAAVGVILGLVGFTTIEVLRAPGTTQGRWSHREAVQTAAPAVVNVYSARRVRTESPPDAPLFDEFFGDGDDATRLQTTLGSGVILDRDGFIVTNHHVVAGADEIAVVLGNGRRLDATIVGSDPDTDIAVLSIDAEGLRGIELAQPGSLAVGDVVLAIGNPFGVGQAVTSGIVSATGRDRLGLSTFEDFIQHDAAVNPGNSGGALVNPRGELVGINTAIASRTGAYEGYGFAVPSNLVERVTEDLIRYGDVRRGFLGVSILEIDADRANELGLDEIRGVYIGTVRDNGAADRAGVEDGDVVLSVNETEVDAPNELQSAVARFRPGDAVNLTVWRDGIRQTYTVELMGRNNPVYENWLSDARPQRRAPESAPESDAPSSPDESAPTPSGQQILELGTWGLGLRALQARERAVFDVRDGGVYVAYVEKDSPAAVAGLPRDVVLMAVDGDTVRSPEQVQSHLEETTGPVLVRVQRRDGTSAFYEVE